MKDLLTHLVQGRPLSFDQAVQAFENIMTGQADAAQTGALLAMVQMRGPTEDELAGAATVMRRHVAGVSAPDGVTVIDTCGTGGDHTPTFNVSTAAALVAGAAGRPHQVVVAKHGNKTVTRASGSSQGLEALGVRLDVDANVQQGCLESLGFCFCFAPAHHPAMKHAMPVRQALGIRTVFNLLGPLTNPAGASRQVMGVYHPDLTEPIARVLGRLGSAQAMVLHGYTTDAADAGFCEISVSGPTRISHLRDGQVSSEQVEPEQLGLKKWPLEDVLVKDPQASAQLIQDVLNGKPGAPRDIVLANAAAALVVAELAADLKQGVNLAAEAIDTGAAKRLLAGLIERTNAG